MQILDRVELDFLYNDGEKGTGTSKDMAIVERGVLAKEGIVIAAIDIARVMPKATEDDEIDEMARGHLKCKVRVTTRGMWTHNNELLKQIHDDLKAKLAALGAAATYALSSSLLLSGLVQMRKSTPRQTQWLCFVDA